MKRSDLKELIKKSMLEVSPTSGAMTPEEEEMVAGYEEEEANKYALDKEEPMEEDILREADEIVAAYAEKKTIKEALDFPRDAVQALADAYKNIEKIYSTFGRDFRFKDEAKQDDYLMIKAILQSINNKLLGLDSDFGYGQGAKLGYDELNEEMHGGYLELFEMNPAFEEGVSMLLTAWDEWKEGPMTEPYMVEEAKQDVLAYLSSMMK